MLRFADGAWASCSLPSGAESLDFRAVWAWNGQRAVVMSSGPGNSSRLYLTDSACRNWRMLAENKDPSGFWDALVFTNIHTGYLLGDPVDGRFLLMDTRDGGLTWNRDDSPSLAAESAGEGAFAASNSSLAVAPGGDLFFGTGGKGGARIFHRHGGAWTSTRVAVGSPSETAGVFSIAFRDERHGIAVGGDFKQPGLGLKTAIWTADSGATWNPARKPPAGYRSSVAWDKTHHAWITAGPNGSDISRDDGATWQTLDAGNWNALSLPWISGPDGRIAKLSAP